MRRQRQQHLAPDFCGLQHRQNDFNSVTAPARVVSAWATVPHRLPKAVQRIALPWSSGAARYDDFARSIQAMNQHAVWRKPYVTVLAGRDYDAKMRKKGLLVRQHATAEAQVLVRLKLAAAHGKLASCLAVAILLLRRSSLSNPVMPLVAVEEVVGAECHRCGGSALEIEKRRTVPGSGACTVKRAHAGAHRTHIAPEQANDLDLMSELVESDAAALLDVEFVGAMRAQQKVVVIES